MTALLTEQQWAQARAAAMAAIPGEVRSAEPTFNLSDALPDQTDDEAVDVFKKALIETLCQFDADELRPAEQRCRRIRALADGKGLTSLTTIVEQKLDDGQAQEFENQPDPLCRSIWAFLNTRQIFEDAESFHFARQFRDYGKMYDAFEVELEKAAAPRTWPAPCSSPPT